MNLLELRGLLVALGCPGPGLCDCYWPTEETWDAGRYNDIQEHIEMHTRQRLGQEETS